MVKVLNLLFDGGRIKLFFRASVFLLKTFAAAVVIFGIIVAWKLSDGPISLSFLVPYVEEKFRSFEYKENLKIEDISLNWEKWNGPIHLKLKNLSIEVAEKKISGTVPEITFSLKKQALIRGEILPQTIRISKPEIEILRNKNRVFDLNFFGLGSFEIGKKSEKDFFVFGDFFKRLEKLDLIDAQIIVKDYDGEILWTPVSDIQLFWNNRGVDGNLSLLLDNEGKLAELKILAQYKKEENTLHLIADFEKLSLTPFVSFLKNLTPFRKLNVPFSGSVSVIIPFDGSPEKVSFDLRGGEGSLNFPTIFLEPVKVTNVLFKGSYRNDSRETEIDDLRVTIDPKSSVRLIKGGGSQIPIKSFSMMAGYDGKYDFLDIKKLQLDLGGADILFSGLASGIAGTRELNASINMRLINMELNDLREYWPKNFKTKMRAAIFQNVSDGLILDAVLDTSFSFKQDGSANIFYLNGQADVSGAAIKIFPGDKGLSDVKSVVKFDGHSVKITIDSGNFQKLRFIRGQILIAELNNAAPQAEINFNIKGSVSSYLDYLVNEKLNVDYGFLSHLGQLTGEVETKLKLSLPLVNNLKSDQIVFSSHSKIRNLRSVNILNGNNLESELLDLAINNKGMILSGKIRLAEIPGELVFEKYFSEVKDHQSQIELSLIIEEINSIKLKGIEHFNLSEEYISGKLGVDIKLTVFDDTDQRIEIDLDLTQSSFAFEKLGWEKAAGIFGRGYVVANLKKMVVADEPQFSIVAGDLNAKGTILYSKKDKGSQKINFENVSYGRSKYKGTLALLSDQSWDVKIFGESLDLSTFWKDYLHNESTKNRLDSSLPTVKLVVDVKNVFLSAEETLQRVSGLITFKQGLFENVDLDVKINHSTSFKFLIQPDLNGKRALKIHAINAGGVFQFFDVFDNMKGGELTITGLFDDTINGEPLNGLLYVRKFRVTNAPVLTQLVSILSLTGLLEILDGKGLSFKSLELPFLLHRGTSKFSSARASGPSLGFTASGSVNHKDEVIELEGTIVPAYALNSVFGKLPLLGKIFTGGERGGGIFAANYKLSGLMENPNITVNPLSALTPGFLRNVFGILDDLKKPQKVLIDK